MTIAAEYNHTNQQLWYHYWVSEYQHKYSQLK